MSTDKLARIQRLVDAGIDLADAWAMRRIAMTLDRWHELECGTDNGCIEQDEESGLWYWVNAYSGKRTHRVADREKSALKRLDAIMACYPDLTAYVQGDPRGCALYILRPGDLREGQDIDFSYTNGIAIY